MNLRERVLAVLNGNEPDCVPWLGDLDYWISALRDKGNLPQKYQGDGIFQLHRDLGVGFYLQGYFPFKTVNENVQIEVKTQRGLRTTLVKTPVGAISATEKYLADSSCWAYEDHFVKSWRDLKPLRYWYEHMQFSPDYDTARRRYDLVGDNGLVLCYLPKSPLMELVALDAGIEAVTYALVDAPEEFEETIKVLGIKADEAARIALNSPAECLMIPENLSSEVVGKKLYNRFMRPYDERWTSAIHEAGKYAFVHMDGTLGGLIAEVASTGFDVLEALTPSPVGDLSVQEMRNKVGDKTIIWGGIPGLFFTDIVSDDEFDNFVVMILSIMKEGKGYVLGVADQVPPGASWSRIKRVSDLVEKYG